MNFRINLLIIFSCLLFTVNAQQHGGGVIRVKFKEDQVPKTQAVTLQQGRFGVSAIDKLNSQYKVSSIKRLFRDAGKYEKAHRKFGLHLWYEITFDSSTPVTAALNSYRNTTAFEVVEAPAKYQRIEPVRQEKALASRASLSTPTSDPLFSDQWHYKNTGQSGGTTGADISLEEAWEIQTGSPDVIVAVIDGGIDHSHPDVQASMWINTDEIANNNIDDDQNGYIDDIYGYGFGDNQGAIPADDHGTHVGGTIAAVTNNGIGVAGIAGGSGTGNGVRLMSCAAFGAFGTGGFEDAMVYAADNGAVISQNSWEGGGSSIEAAIDYFVARAGYDNSEENFDDNIQIGPMAGGLVIFAAGNSNSTFGYPAPYAPVMAVASTDNFDTKSWFSNYGSWIDISAPGSDVLSTTPANTYSYNSGTSMACPHVSGVAALVISKFKPVLEPSWVWQRLQSTADPIDGVNPSYTGQLGSGRLNAFNAVLSDDEIPPAAISDLVASEPGVSSVRLTWTASGASGTDGTATTYQVRYSSSPITESGFETATPVEDVPDPEIAGTVQSFTVTGLSHTTQYYFAIKSVDFFGNTSLVSNSAVATTLEPPIMEVSPEFLTANLLTDAIEVRTITIANTGVSTLYWNADVSAAWLLLDAYEGEVEPGEETSIEVMLDATDLNGGLYTGTITILSNDPENPEQIISVDMDVTGVPDISANATQLDFGVVYSQFSTEELEIIVTNTGTDLLTVSAVSLTASSFFQLSPSAPFTLEPESSKTFTVAYEPLSVGDHNAILTLSSDDVDEPVLEIDIAGEAIQIPVTVTPSVLESAQRQNTTVDKSFTLQNISPTALDWTITLSSDDYSLDSHLSALNESYSAVTSLIPNSYNFSDGVFGSYIYDGGGDMYDDGNNLNTNITSSITYSDNTIKSSGSFGPGSRYFTRKVNGLFVLAVDAMNISSFTVNGNLGADGSGTADAAVLSATYNGKSYKGFVKRVYNAWDPSVNHLIIVEDNGSVSQSISTNTDSDFHHINNLSGISRMSYLLFASSSGGFINNNVMQQIMETYLQTTSGVPHWVNVSSDAGTLSTGSTVEIQAQFDSEEMDFGTHHAEMNIVMADPDYPAIRIPVSLTVISVPEIETDPSIDFGVSFTDIGKDSTIIISNNGSAELSVTAITSSAPQFIVSFTPFALAPGETKYVPITFISSSVGLFTATLSIVSNDPDQGTLEVELLAEAIQIPFVVNPSSIQSSQLRGRQVNQIITLTNNTGTGLNWELTGLSTGADNLSEHLNFLNNSYTSVTNLIPNKYLFSGGSSGVSIEDGGNDMYDYGNYLATNAQDFIPYSDNVIQVQNYFGSGSSYFTRKFDGLFVLAVEDMSIPTFTISGDLGADESGITDATVLTATFNGRSFKGFVKRVYNASDPSVNHLIIVEDNGLVSQSTSVNTNSDYHQITNLTGVDELYYLLFAGSSGAYIDDQAMQQIMDAYIRLFTPGPDWFTVNMDEGFLNAGSSVQITGNFNSEGLAVGSYEAGINIITPDAGYPPVAIPLSLLVLSAPEIAVDRNSINFGKQELHHPASEVVWIINNGTELLQIDQVTSNHTAFTTEPTALDILPGDTAPLTISYSAPEAGVHDAEITLTSNDVINPDFIIDVTGETELRFPDVEISRTSIDFGLKLSTITLHDFVWIKNTGTASLDLTDITSSSAYFTTSLKSASILPDDSLKLTISYNASVAGIHSGEIKIEVNVEDSPEIIVDVKGQTTTSVPDIRVTKIINFGKNSAGHVADAAVWIINTGTELLEIESILTDNPLFTVSATSFTISPSDSAQLFAYYSSLEAGVHHGTINLETNIENKPVTSISVSGETFIPPTISLTVDETNPSVNRRKGATITALIKNEGSEQLEWSLSGLPSWATVSDLSGTLDGGQEKSLDIRLATVNLKALLYTFTIRLDCNDPVTPTSSVPVTVEIIPNNSPLVILPIADRVLEFGSDKTEILLTEHFSDPDSSVLEFDYTTNVASVVSMQMVNSTLQIIPLQVGSVRINVFAEDDLHAEASVAFNVVVTKSSLVTGIPEMRQEQVLLNSPNPFTGSTVFSYSLKKAGIVSILIKDVNGRQIESLMNDYQQQGDHETAYDASALSSGFYLYHLIVDGNLVDSGKMLKK